MPHRINRLTLPRACALAGVSRFLHSRAAGRHGGIFACGGRLWGKGLRNRANSRRCSRRSGGRRERRPRFTQPIACGGNDATRYKATGGHGRSRPGTASADPGDDPAPQATDGTERAPRATHRRALSCRAKTAEARPCGRAPWQCAARGAGRSKGAPAGRFPPPLFQASLFQVSLFSGSGGPASRRSAPRSARRPCAGCPRRTRG